MIIVKGSIYFIKSDTENMPYNEEEQNRYFDHFPMSEIKSVFVKQEQKEQDAFEMAVGAKKSLALSKRRLQQQKNEAQEALERVRKMFTQLRYSFATLTDLVTNRINSF